jgi:predicted transposase/invertase (TIGR01784 family)
LSKKPLPAVAVFSPNAVKRQGEIARVRFSQPEIITTFALNRNEMNYLDPKNDLTFKKLFGQHPHLLKSFLNAMLPLQKGRFIQSLEYLPAELAPENPLQKYSIVDVRCFDNHGRQFIVEMQMHWTTGFMQRVLFNASKAYVRQLNRSFKFNSLQPVYALSLVNENFQPDKPEYYHHYQIVNIEDTDQQIEGLEFVFVELPKFKARNLTEKKLQVLWLRFLTEIDENTTEVPDDLLESSEIKEALENLKTSAFTKAEMQAYDKYWDAVRVELTLQSGYFTQGFAQGELQMAYKTAIKGFAKNISNENLSEITGLAIHKIELLKRLYQKFGDDAINHLQDNK